MRKTNVADYYCDKDNQAYSDRLGDFVLAGDACREISRNEGIYYTINFSVVGTRPIIA